MSLQRAVPSAKASLPRAVLCRGLLCLALGKECLCRVPEIWPSANPQALGKARVSSSEAIAVDLVAGGGGDGSGGRRQVLMAGEVAVMVGAAGLWRQGTAGGAAGGGGQRRCWLWPWGQRGSTLSGQQLGEERIWGRGEKVTGTDEFFLRSRALLPSVSLLAGPQ